MRKIIYLLFVLTVFSCNKNKQNQLNLAIIGEGSVSPQSGVFDKGEIVSLLASPEDGWQFSKWSGDECGNTNPLAVMMDKTKNITAHFINHNNSDIQGVLNSVTSLGGSLNETIIDIANTDDGGFVCVGSAQSSDSAILPSSNGESDYLIMKFDSNINLEWSKLYGGSGNDVGRKVVPVSDGYVISGYTKSDDLDVTVNNGKKDFWLIKLDLEGALIWEKSHGYMGDDESFSIIETQDGGFFTTGYIDVTESNGGGNDGLTDAPTDKNLHGIGDFWGIKLDANGEYIWRRYFGGFNNDKGYDVVETSEGDFVIAGASESIDVDITNPKGSYDIWIVKVSSQGNLIWEKSFGGSEQEECYKIIPTDDGNYFVLGNTRSNDQDVSNNHGFADLWLIKITPEGSLLWEKTYGGNLFDSASSIIRLNDGNYMISGNSRSDDIYEIKGQNDVLLIKIDPTGSVLWEKTYGGSGIDIANDLIELNESIIVVGDSQSDDFDITTNNGFTDALLLEIK